MSSIYDGMGFNVTVCTYVDRVGVGYVTEAILMRNIAELVPLTEQAFAELEVALGIRSAPRASGHSVGPIGPPGIQPAPLGPAARAAQKAMNRMCSRS